MSVPVNGVSVGQPAYTERKGLDQSIEFSARSKTTQPRNLVTRACRECGAEFTIRASRLKHGRGLCCSKSCASRHAGRQGMARVRELYPQQGSGNFNFRGWRSKHPVLYTRAFKAAHPKKWAAQRAVHAAVRAGRLVRPATCERCGCSCRPHAHHEDYSRPLDVMWVCRSCHVVLDRERRLREQPSVLHVLVEHESLVVPSVE
jgi:hypothetical protein